MDASFHNTFAATKSKSRYVIVYRLCDTPILDTYALYFHEINTQPFLAGLTSDFSSQLTRKLNRQCRVQRISLHNTVNFRIFDSMTSEVIAGLSRIDGMVREVSKTTIDSEFEKIRKFLGCVASIRSV